MLEGRKGTLSRVWLSLLVTAAVSGGALACLQDPPDPSVTGGDAAASAPSAAAPSAGEEPDIRLPLAGIVHEEGLCYMARIPLIVPNERDEGQTGIRLFEDDVELTKADTHHADIREAGGGGFSQWGETLYFSSTDGSDPTTNGRRYTIVFPRRTIIDQLSWDFVRIADIPVDAIRSGTGCEFIYDLPPVISGWPSDVETLNGSRLIVLEDGAPLSHPHSRADLISLEGGGRYQHYGNELRFSTSDNSNPKTNGRVYSIALGDLPDNRFVDPLVGIMPNLRESLPAPVLDWPTEGEVITEARPTLRVKDPDPSLLYYWELDVVPTFDSANLHRSPRTRQSRAGGNPLRVLDREPSFAPEFTPPYRLGALAPLITNRGAWQYTQIMAARLGYALPTGADELREVFAYISSQFYPVAESAQIREPEDTWRRDRGFCVSVNYLASQILEDLGYHARRVQVDAPSSDEADAAPISSHSSMEVFCDGRWSIFDPWLGFYLDGVSYESLAATTDQPRFLALRYPPRPGAKVEDWLPLYLSDYARGRRYDRFDSWFVDLSSSAAERIAFSGEPAEIPDPQSSVLWRKEQMQVWVRVRSVALTPEVVLTGMLPRPEAMNFHEQEIDVSPWTTVSFTIDLAKAYGFEVPLEESPGAEPAE